MLELVSWIFIHEKSGKVETLRYFAEIFIGEKDKHGR